MDPLDPHQHNSKDTAASNKAGGARDGTHFECDASEFESASDFECAYPGVASSSHSLSNYAGASPFLSRSRGTQQQFDVNAMLASLPPLSPMLQGLLRAELSQHASDFTANDFQTLPSRWLHQQPQSQTQQQPSPARPPAPIQTQQQQQPSFRSPCPMQPSPAPALLDQKEPARLFGAELDTTENIPVSALKRCRPAESLAPTREDRTEHQSAEPPAKKLRRTDSDGENEVHDASVAHGGPDQDNPGELGELTERNDNDNDNDDEVFAFPSVPGNAPNNVENKTLHRQLEPITCAEKRKAVANFCSSNPCNDFSTALEYDLRIRECKTLGRKLTGSWCGITGCGDAQWFHHPVNSFYLWLRIAPNGTESLWTRRDGKWKMNVHERLFSEKAKIMYRELWQDKDFLQQNTSTKGDPRTSKRAFKSVLFSTLYAGRGDDQFQKFVDAFWNSEERKALHTKYSDAEKEQKQQGQPPLPAQLQQQQPTTHVAAGASASILSPGAIAAGASASIVTIASGAIASGASVYATHVHNHYHYHFHTESVTSQVPPPPTGPASQPTDH